MSIAALIRSMADAGATPEAIALAVEAIESVQATIEAGRTACMERGVAAAAMARSARTHCKRNHPLSGDNLFLTSGGSRGCKACRRIHKATHRSKANG